MRDGEIDEKDPDPDQVPENVEQKEEVENQEEVNRNLQLVATFVRSLGTQRDAYDDRRGDMYGGGYDNY